MLSENVPLPRLDPSRLVYIGLRDVEKEERRILERLNIAAYYMSDIDHLGIERVVEEGLQRVDATNTARIHLSFDIDALDPRGEYNVSQASVFWRTNSYLIETDIKLHSVYL